MAKAKEINTSLV